MVGSPKSRCIGIYGRVGLFISYPACKLGILRIRQLYNAL